MIPDSSIGALGVSNGNSLYWSFSSLKNDESISVKEELLVIVSDHLHVLR